MRKFAISLFLLSLFVLPSVSHADPGNDWCVTPAFVSGNIPPNLLLMIDNSASMYDLAYVDKGKKHCSTTNARSCFVNADCPDGETCSAFDRQPVYCYDQSYSNPNPDVIPKILPYAGYFANKDRSGNDIYYSYDLTNDAFVKATAAFPADCVAETGTIIKQDNNSTFCIKYDNTTTKTLRSFIAKGNYLNWLTASKFDVEKQILTGGKQVGKVCATHTDVMCNTSDDCPIVPSTSPAAHEACNTVSPLFLMPESRGCVGQGFVKDAITTNFANYNAPASNNTNTQMGITFSVHGPLDPLKSSPSVGGQTYIDLFASGRNYDYGDCQAAIDALSATNPNLSTIKTTVAACLSGSASGYCSDNVNISCFSTYPDCSIAPSLVCSNDYTTTCTTLGSNCTGTKGTCVNAYYCEGVGGTTTNIMCTTVGKSGQCPTQAQLCDEVSPCTTNANCPTGRTCGSNGYCTAVAPSISCPTVGSTTGCTSYKCDWSTSVNPKTCSGTADSASCYSQNNQNGKCADTQGNPTGPSCQGTTTNPTYDSGCSRYNPTSLCIGWVSQGSHSCVIETNHGVCRLINGATDGVCGAQQSYGTCIFGATDPLTKSKVNFQQSMQACWQSKGTCSTSATTSCTQNSDCPSGGTCSGHDVGIDDLKTLAKQCSDLYNGIGTQPAYKTCSNNPEATCTRNDDCTGSGGTTGTCIDGPAAIVPGYPALMCGVGWAGQLFYKNGNTWVMMGSLNDNSISLSNPSRMGTPVSSITITGTLPNGTVVTDQTMPKPTDCATTDDFPTCMYKVYKKFCSGTIAPGVTDPTDSPSDTSSYDNLPAILSGIAVQSQLGQPIKTMRARISSSTCTADTDCSPNKVCSGGVCTPTGLIQQFGPQLRIGAMTFNGYGVGNITEGGNPNVNPVVNPLPGIIMTKVCSNNTSQVCSQNADCNGGTCTTTVDAAAATGTQIPNYDGGRVLYPVGKGHCATMTTTTCTTDNTCDSGEKCLNGYCGTLGSGVCTTAANCTTGTSQACYRDAVGSHGDANSLVQTIDRVRAEAWTPFAETFFNALGYFAAVPQTGGGFKGRSTPLRINSINATSTDFSSLAAAPMDYNDTLNPSEYRCQQNYILLVTDGSSTADRNSTVSDLASLYATQAGGTAGTCTTNGRDYGGTSNLPILSWIGNHQNLATFSTSTSVTGLYCPDQRTACSSSGTCTMGTCANGQACSATVACVDGSSCGNMTTTRNCASYHCSVTTSRSCGGNPALCTGDEVCTRSPRDFVSTYVVFNGADNGGTSVCDAYNLLNTTAQNGGTQLKQATDPASLTTALTSIFENIAAKASSGTAASILSNSEGSGANILQAVFYPKKVFDNQTSSNWVGEMQNLWYFVDPLISHSTIREDTDRDTSDPLLLNLKTDHVVSLRFDSSDNTTYAYVSVDNDGNGTGDTTEVKEDPDLVKSVWRAGRQLWQRDLSTRPRTIYTPLVDSGVQVGSTGLMTFSYGAGSSTDNSGALASYLQMENSTTATKLMKYVHGFDFPGENTWRSRTVQSKTIKTDYVASGVTYPDSNSSSSTYTSNPRDKGLGVWKLADIISSTPRIQSNGRLNNYGLPSPGGYSDASYNSFVGSEEYKARGMVYVGANDGMMHAFKLGLLDVTASGFQKAKLSGTDLGEEQWAFLPKQALPYLTYYSDPAYNHIYYVDGSTLLLDASIGVRGGTGGCLASTYETCVKLPVVTNSTNHLDAAANTWRTVLIGGMGLGGATAKTCTTDNCVHTPTADPADGTGATGLGLSSYYALDITDPNNPVLLWEFNNSGLGYATTGPSIVRIGDRDHNGKWFAVFGTGPTGKIDTASHQFMGYSDKPLKFFAIDLSSGTKTDVDSTWAGIPSAFAGSMMGGSIDADRWNPNVTGYYQDDAIYVGYTMKKGTAWNDGGVLRIVTNEDANPRNWRISYVTPLPTTLSPGVGPVTSGIARLQDRKNRALWLYFGAGRYYSRSGTTIDDFSSQRSIYGLIEPCYNSSANPGNFIDKTCTDTISSGSIVNQTSSVTPVGASGGWQVDLDGATETYGAERVVTDAVALTNGTVFLTSFEPTADLCGFGGNSYLWALDYRTGGRPSDAALSGKALIQLSTGEFKEVELSTAFTDSTKLYRRSSIPMTGKPPADAFPVVSKSSNKPVKKILHIQER